MSKRVPIDLNPRKLPRQARSLETLKAIQSGTIQVLLKGGTDRLTMILVAQRAGVSVGTLYQYFPNKQALLLAILEEHMARIASAVEAVCAASRFQPVASMLDALVRTYLDAKLCDRETATALYLIFKQMREISNVSGVRRRCQTAITFMLQTAALPAPADVRYMARIIYLAMAATVHGHLESSSLPSTTHKLRNHLTRLVVGYCETTARTLQIPH